MADWLRFNGRPHSIEEGFIGFAKDAEKCHSRLGWPIEKSRGWKTSGFAENLSQSIGPESTLET